MSTSPELACPVPVPLLPPAEVTDELQSFIDRGIDPRWVRAMGHAPGLLTAWTSFYGREPFTGSERAAVRFAEAMHQAPRDVAPQVLSDVRAAFRDAEFVELG